MLSLRWSLKVPILRTVLDASRTVVGSLEVELCKSSSPPSTRSYSTATWRPIGRKEQLVDVIARTTGIEGHYLTNPQNLRRASVACRMSWASHRKTTRTEDIAYCLLGILGVNMPLLYGEGHKAFLRLQQHILESTPDDSLFAWTSECGDKSAGVFANDPSAFAKSRQIVPTPRMISLPPHRSTSLGVEFFFPRP